MINAKRYQNACVEVLAVLHQLNEREYNRIPKRRIKLYEINQSHDYEFHLEEDKDFAEQVSYDAKIILANLFVRYVATPEDRKKIYEKEKKEFVEKEMQKLQSDSEEKKIEKASEGQETIENLTETQMDIHPVKKTNFFHQLWTRMKKFFKAGE